MVCFVNALQWTKTQVENLWLTPSDYNDTTFRRKWFMVNNANAVTQTLAEYVARDRLCHELEQGSLTPTDEIDLLTLRAKHGTPGVLELVKERAEHTLDH